MPRFIIKEHHKRICLLSETIAYYQCFLISFPVSFMNKSFKRFEILSRTENQERKFQSNDYLPST